MAYNTVHHAEDAYVARRPLVCAKNGPSHGMPSTREVLYDRPIHVQPPVQRMAVPGYNLEPIMAPLVRKFNMYAEVLGSCAHSPRPWKSAARALKTEEEVSDLVFNLMEKLEDLKHSVYDFAGDVARDADKQWYRNGQRRGQDWTKYFRSELEKALHVDHQELLSAKEDNIAALNICDMRDFAAYLHEALPATVRATHQREQDDLYATLGSARRSEPNGRKDGFKERISSLIRKTEERNDWDIAFHLYVFAMTDLRMAQSGEQEHAVHKYCFHSLADAYHDFSNKAYEAYLIGEHRGDITYWAFASAWRALWEEWQQRDQVNRQEHSALQFLKFVYQEVTKEIRTMTYFALSGPQPDLPIELAEDIVEYVMLVEGVPLSYPPETTMPVQSGMSAIVGLTDNDFSHLGAPP